MLPGPASEGTVAAMREAPCRICDSPGPHPDYVVREMQFGTREEFPYFQCVSCSCLQIVEIPADMGRHYPADYYSYTPPPGPPGGATGPSPRPATRQRSGAWGSWASTT